tara:strand:- start:32 stop:9532 length:9501 start_codon:yes stop_codon:yes gene_type:complete
MYKYLIDGEEVIFNSNDERIKGLKAAMAEGFSIELVEEDKDSDAAEIKKDTEEKIVADDLVDEDLEVSTNPNELTLENMQNGNFATDAATSADVVSETQPAQDSASESFSKENFTEPVDLIEQTGSFSANIDVEQPGININYDQILRETGGSSLEEINVPKRGAFGYKSNEELVAKLRDQDQQKAEANVTDEKTRAYYQRVNVVESLAVENLLKEVTDGFIAAEGQAEFNRLAKDAGGREEVIQKYSKLIENAFNKGNTKITKYKSDRLAKNYFEKKYEEAKEEDAKNANNQFTILEDNDELDAAFDLVLQYATNRMGRKEQDIVRTNLELSKAQQQVIENEKYGASGIDTFYAIEKQNDLRNKREQQLEEVRNLSPLDFDSNGNISADQVKNKNAFFDSTGKFLTPDQVNYALENDEEIFDKSSQIIEILDEASALKGKNTKEYLKNSFIVNGIEQIRIQAQSEQIIYIKPKEGASILWNPYMFSSYIPNNEQKALAEVSEKSLIGSGRSGVPNYKQEREKDEDGYMPFTVSEISKAINSGDWSENDFILKYQGDLPVKEKGFFYEFHDERVRTNVKQKILNDLVVLGADLSTYEEDNFTDHVVEFGRNAAINLPFVGDSLNESIGDTKRVYKDKIREQYQELGIAETKEMSNNFDRAWSMHLAEGAGAFVPVLGEFAVVNYLTGGLASAVGATKLTNSLLKSSNFLARNTGHLMKAIGEEVKFKIVTTGESKTGSGFGFYAGGTLLRRLMPFRFNAKYEWANPANKALENIILGGIGGATAGEVALVTEAFYDAVMDNKDYQTSMEEMFGEDVDVWQRFTVSAVQFAMLGGYNNFKYKHNYVKLPNAVELSNKYRRELNDAKNNNAGKFAIDKLEKKVQATDQIIASAQKALDQQSIGVLKSQITKWRGNVEAMRKDATGKYSYADTVAYNEQIIKNELRISKLKTRAKKKIANINKNNDVKAVIESIEGDIEGGFKIEDGKNKVRFNEDSLSDAVIQHEMGHDALSVLGNSSGGKKMLEQMVEDIRSKVEKAYKLSEKYNAAVGNKNKKIETFEEYVNRRDQGNAKSQGKAAEEYLMYVITKIKSDSIFANSLANKGVFKNMFKNIAQFAKNQGVQWGEGKFSVTDPNSQHRASEVINLLYSMANAKNKGYKVNKTFLDNLFVNEKEQVNSMGEPVNTKEVFSQKDIKENSKINKEINEEYKKLVDGKMEAQDIGRSLQFMFLDRIKNMMKSRMEKDGTFIGGSESGETKEADKEIKAFDAATEFLMDTRSYDVIKKGGKPIEFWEMAIKPYIDGQNIIKAIQEKDLSIKDVVKLLEDGGYATGANTKEGRAKELHDMATGKKPEGSLTTYVYRAIDLNNIKGIDRAIKSNEEMVFVEGDEVLDFLVNEGESIGETGAEFEIQAKSESKKIVEAYKIKEGEEGYVDIAGETRRNSESAMDILSISKETRLKADEIVDKALSEPIEGLEAFAVGSIDLGNGKVYEVEIPTESNRAITFSPTGEREEYKSFQKPKDLALKLQKREKAKYTRISIDQSKTPEQRAEAAAEATRLDNLVYKKDFSFVKNPERLFKVKLERQAEEALYENIFAEMGKVGSKENLYWLAKTRPLMENYIGLNQVTKRFPGLYEPVMIKDADGKLKQDRKGGAGARASGNRIFKKSKISQTEYFDYFKNDVVKQVSLAKALAREFAFDKVADRIMSGAAKEIVLKQGGIEEKLKLTDTANEMLYRHIQRGGGGNVGEMYTRAAKKFAKRNGLVFSEVTKEIESFYDRLLNEGLSAFDEATKGAQYIKKIVNTDIIGEWIVKAEEQLEASDLIAKYKESGMKKEFDPSSMENTSENVEKFTERGKAGMGVFKYIFKNLGIETSVLDATTSQTMPSYGDFFFTRMASYQGVRLGLTSKINKKLFAEYPPAPKDAAGNIDIAKQAENKKARNAEKAKYLLMNKEVANNFYKESKEINNEYFGKGLAEAFKSTEYVETAKNFAKAIENARVKMDAWVNIDFFKDGVEFKGKVPKGDNVAIDANVEIARTEYSNSIAEVINMEANLGKKFTTAERSAEIKKELAKRLTKEGAEAILADNQALMAGNKFMLTTLGKMNRFKTDKGEGVVQQIANMMYNNQMQAYRKMSPESFYDLSIMLKNAKGKTPKQILKMLKNEHIKTRKSFFNEVFKALKSNTIENSLESPLIVNGIVDGYWSLISSKAKQGLVDALTFPKMETGASQMKGSVKSADMPALVKIMLTVSEANTAKQLEKVWGRIGPKGTGVTFSDIKALYYTENVAGENLLSKLIESMIKNTEFSPIKQLKTDNELYSKKVPGADKSMNGKQILEALSIEEIKAKREAADKGKQLEKELAGMIERKGGTLEEATVSDSKAYMEGKKRYDDLFLPSSSEDLQGLLYKPYGKGKQGDADMEFMKENILRPLTRAENALSVYRMKLAEDYAGLEKQIKEMGETKPEKAAAERVEKLGYNIDQAVRVYIWQKLGMDIPGISLSEKSQLTGAVLSSAKLRAYANGIMNITKTKEKYPEPKDNWFRSNVQYDLFTHATDGVRSDFLFNWQENVDAMFTKENLNKLESRFGGKYRYNLEQMLTRIKVGKSRPESTNAAFNTTLNYINGSVATIMFLNMRSAALQTISAANYVNWSDNNPAAIAKVIGEDPKAFLETAKKIWSSDALRDRRTGLKINVQEAEMAKAIRKGGRTGAQQMWDQMIQIGFKPTQMADSFAIVMGGTPFYMNRMKTYEKQGMGKNEAADRAWEDFLDKTQEGQQSSQMDRVSNIQTGLMGRLVFSFNNTPFQMSRLQKKAFLDLKNNRGDKKTNVSRLGYYAFVQSTLFYGMQQAFYSGLMNDDADLTESQKVEKYNNFDKRLDKLGKSVWQGVLTGSGLPGKVAVTGYNTGMKMVEQYDKGYQGKDFFPILSQVLSISPTLGSKVNRLGRNWESLIMSEKTKKGQEFSNTFNTFDPRNPNAKAYISMIGTATNIPLDRIVAKIENISGALDAQNELWQRAAMLIGTPKYQLQTKEQNDRDRQDIIDNFYKENTPKGQRDIDAIESLTNAEQKKFLIGINANPYFIKTLDTQSERTSAIISIALKNGFDIEKEYMKYETPVIKRSEEYKNLQELGRDGQIDLLKDMRINPYQIENAKSEEKRIKLILSSQARRKRKVDSLNSLK